MGETEDGWESRIWVRGRFALRIRSRGSSCVLHELEDRRSTRRFTGPLEPLGVNLAKDWFKRNKEL